MSRLRNTTLKNFGWRFAERFGSQGVSFLVSIVLARVLSPDVYGTIALVTAFIAILNVFIESGMGTALVQKKEADDLDYSTLFCFNIAMCLAIYALLFFCAPLVSAFYENEQFTSILRVLGLSLLISGVKGIQISYVSRNMIFKKFFFATLIATVISAFVGIWMAYSGFGIWALVAQQLTSEGISTVILWITVPWRPKLMFSMQRLKGMFSYGWKLLASSLLESVYNEMRQLLIGKIYTSADLAYYNRGRQFPNFIVNNINSSIKSVLLPSMSRMQDSVQQVKAMTRRSVCVSTYIMAPMMIGLAVCAEPVVVLLLTEKWMGAVFFLRIFAINFMFYPVHTANLNSIKALGRSDVFLKLEIVKKVMGMILLLTTLFISVEAMAYSLLVSTLLGTIINAFPNNKLLGYSWFEQMRDILPHIGLAVVMGIPVYIMQWLPLPMLVVLVLQIMVGVVIYVGLSALLHLDTFYYLLNILKGFLGKKKL